MILRMFPFFATLKRKTTMPDTRCPKTECVYHPSNSPDAAAMYVYRDCHRCRHLTPSWTASAYTGERIPLHTDRTDEP